MFVRHVLVIIATFIFVSARASSLAAEDICARIAAQGVYAEETVRNNDDFKNAVKNRFCVTHLNRQRTATEIGLTIPLLETVGQSLGVDFSDENRSSFRASNCGDGSSQNTRIAASEIHRRFGDSKLAETLQTCVVENFAAESLGFRCSLAVFEPSTPEVLKLTMAWRPTDNAQSLTISSLTATNADCAPPVEATLEPNRRMVRTCKRSDIHKAATVVVGAAGFDCAVAAPAEPQPSPPQQVAPDPTCAELVRTRWDEVPQKWRFTQICCVQHHTLKADLARARALETQYRDCLGTYANGQANKGSQCMRILVFNPAATYRQQPIPVQAAEQAVSEATTRTMGILRYVEQLTDCGVKPE